VTTEKAVDQQPRAPRAKWALRRPSVGQASALVGLIGGVVALVFIFKPGWKPQAPSNASKATISDTRVFQPVTFKRYLQRLQLPITKGLSHAYLNRAGVMVSFHYEIVGLRHKKLPLRWELSNTATNDLVASQDSAFTLVPANDDDAGDWSVWVPAPKRGPNYYVTVTIYQPQGPPYELKHFDSPNFPGLGS
jgi:hypothetical protein